MEFVRELHTKQFLLENKNILEVLAKTSADFAVSHLSEDVDFLKTKVHGQSVAHILAINQSSWLASSASKNFEVLSLRDSFEITVAHYLAQYQSDWALSESAENLDVLMLRGNAQLTVAHVLAQHQQDWLKSSASKDVNILKLMDKDKWTVAQFLVGFNPNSFNHEALYQKSILSIELYDMISGNANGKYLSQYMYSTYKGNGLTIPSFALKHISLGLAYKHPKLLTISDLNEIFKQSKFLIEDSNEPLIALKQLLAIYSTLHNDWKQASDSPMEKNNAGKRGELVSKAEKMLRQFIQKNSYLLELQHPIEFWCEPGHHLLNIITSEYHLKNSKTDDLIDVNDYLDEPAKPSLY